MSKYYVSTSSIIERQWGEDHLPSELHNPANITRLALETDISNHTIKKSSQHALNPVALYMGFRHFSVSARLAGRGFSTKRVGSSEESQSGKTSSIRTINMSMHHSKFCRFFHIVPLFVCFQSSSTVIKFGMPHDFVDRG